MPTDDELAAIEARCNAATPGPWYPVFTDDDSSMNAVYVGTVDRGDRHDNKRGFTRDRDDRASEIVAVTLHQLLPRIDHESELWDENAEFIAHARTDIPDLVAEVRRLRELLDDCLHYVEQTKSIPDIESAEFWYGASKLIERLREQLRKETT